MYKIILIFIILIIFFSIFPQDSFAHKSWCNIWHTCPSNTGSYSYTPKLDKSKENEIPNYYRCPNGYSKNDEGICEKKIANNKKENKNSYKEKITLMMIKMI